MNATATSKAAERRSGQLNSALARSWWAVGLRGMLAIIFGLIALILPEITMLSLVLVFAAFALLDGVLAIIAAVRAARRKDRWGVLALQGGASVIAGILAVLWPGLTVIAFVLLVAVWSIVTGLLMLGAGFHLNIDHGRWWLLLGGFLATAFGVLLIIAPLVGAIVLTWWIGAFAVAHGVLLLIVMYRLWLRRDHDSPRIPVRGGT